MKRKANAIWKGTGKEGTGTLNGASGVLKDTPYSFKTRFENEEGKAGTNPEELIAAAHAGCYAMALSFALQEAGYTADELHTDAELTLDAVEGGFAITGIQLNLQAKVSGVEEPTFVKLAQDAKENCPVSKALQAVPIELDITLRA